jgi:hypothetical protein
VTYLARDLMSYFMFNQGNTAILVFIGLILTLTTFAFTTSPVQAETGIGQDVFRVIMSIFGVDETKGDVVAIVTVMQQE